MTPSEDDGRERVDRAPDTLWRAAARRALAAAIEDPDEEIVASAAVALGKTGDATQAPLLIGVLRSDTRRRMEREAAALGLGLLTLDSSASDNEIREALIDVAGDAREPTRLRAIAVHALGLRRDEASVPFLVSAMSTAEADWDVPAAATAALGCVGDDLVRGDLQRVLAGGRGIDRVQRVYAAQALSKSGGPATVRALVRSALDDDPHVRRASYLALSAIGPGDEAAIDALVRAVHRERNGGARCAAAIALGLTGHERAEAPLRHAYEKGNAELQRFAGIALGLLARARGEPDLVQRLEVDLRERANSDLRGALAIALGLARRRAAGPLLREIAASRGDPTLRRYAALAVGLVGDSEGAPALRAVLAEESEPRLRAAAATALGLLGDQTTVPDLVRSLAGRDSVFVQGSTAIALGRIGGVDAARALTAVLDDASRPEIVRSSAAIALGVLLDQGEGDLLAETGRHLEWTTLTTTVYELLQIQ